MNLMIIFIQINGQWKGLFTAITMLSHNTVYAMKQDYVGTYSFSVLDFQQLQLPVVIKTLDWINFM